MICEYEILMASAIDNNVFRGDENECERMEDACAENSVKI